MRCWASRESSNFQVVAINDTSDPRTNAHLLQYDSMLGKFNADISADENATRLSVSPIATLKTCPGETGKSISSSKQRAYSPAKKGLLSISMLARRKF